LGFERVLILVPGSAKRFILSSTEWEVLRQCDRTDSLTSHLNRICTTADVRSEDRSRVAAILQELLKKSLLITETESVGAGGAKLNQRIAALALVTAERPETMSRALASYRGNFQEYERDPAILILDDSKSDRARSRYLDSAKRSGPTRNVRYAGRKEKLEFVERLVDQGIDRSVANFALLGGSVPPAVTTGANRNCVLLDLTGEFLLLADDDTVCTFVAHPEPRATLKLGNHESPREIWFYRTREEVITAANSQRCDLLKEHENLLGRSLPELLVPLPTSCIDSDDACKHLLEATGRTEARVVLTMPGVAGDSGARYAQRFLLASERALRQLNESESAAELAFTSREVLWVAPEPTINHSSHCQAGGLGIANTELMPPFFPIGRNQDGVFGVLNMLSQNSFFGHLPIALLHDAERGRTYQPLPSFDISELIISLIHSLFPRQYGGIGSSLCSIGKDLLQIGRLADRDFWEIVITSASENAARNLRLLDLRRKRMDHCTTFIQREFDRYRDYVFASLTTAPYFVPIEFVDLPVEFAREEIRKLVQRTAQLFCAWPDLVKASQYLKSKGIGIAREIDRISD
jgi:hypothetical protein